MSGIVDGVSKVFSLSFERGSLHLDGFKTREEMLKALIYRVLSEGYENPEAAIDRLTALVGGCVAQFRKDYETEVV